MDKDITPTINESGCSCQVCKQAYQQGHLDACKDDRCALLPDTTIPTYRAGFEDGQAMVRKEVSMLIERVQDVAWKAAQYGSTEDGDTYAYLVPKGAMHRLIGEAQAHGFTSVAFRNPGATDVTADRDLTADSTPTITRSRS